MRVQRKHDLAQAKLKEERQQTKGGTPGAAGPNPKAPPPVGKARGTNPPPKGEKAPPRRSVRFQNHKEKGRPRPAMPPTTKKDTVNEAADTGDLSDTDGDTDELADLPIDSRAGRYHRGHLGGGTGTRRRTPMTIKEGGQQ